MTADNPVRWEADDDVLVITIDNPPVNALRLGVRVGIIAAIDALEADSALVGAVITGAGRAFIAGADITEFGKPPQDPNLNDAIFKVEGSSKPVVAAINGVALGGGLEVALGCHGRIAHPKARVGVPEVHLGLLPGAGGTQRLPRVAGVEVAVDMTTTGKHVPAPKALSAGVIDAIEEDCVTAAKAKARELAAAGTWTVVAELPNPTAPEGYFEAARAQIEKKARGQMSPILGLQAVQAAVDLAFDEGMKRERALFIDGMASDQSRGLIHAFFGEREVAKIPGLDPEAQPRDVKTAAIIGAGTMGGGIAMCFANAGIPVTVLEQSQEALDKGLGVCRKNYENTAKKGRLTMEQVEERMALFTGTTDINDLADVDIVIEAVFENMDVKKDIFTKLDAVCKQGCVLATNTSTLDINQIASVTKRPEDVIGMHFFSPANVMRLLENVRGDATADDVILTAMNMGKRLGKVSVLVGVCDGFVGNRILHEYIRWASILLEDGCLPEQIDKVWTDFGMPMGPFAMSDLAGLDVGYRIRKEQEATRSSNVRYVHIADKVVEMGRLGQKTGGGFFDYIDGSRVPVPNAEVTALVLAESERKGIERRAFSDEEILNALTDLMTNEGAKILEEGIAMRPVDVDITYIFGYGYPAYRGGPMHRADAVGLAETLARIKARYEETGDHSWKPAALLEQLVAEGKTFAEWSSARAA
ncbi:MAG: 3-hydroxyacyl-CoA dehydrogenase [Alphaproteobacteria bacterium TMED89]|nr:3-hydroxyacyl-CoA dehydrogenase [Rhodospirillaceae bacterium]RPH17608.1 MAG: 3-hydroxyacyl-CoA dehydrogenase [Alphaproteobacteria bacterium TMED89]